MADHLDDELPRGNDDRGPCGEDTPQMWYDMGLAVDPNNPDALFLDAIDIWKSTDGGHTLTDISCGYYAGLNPIGSPVHVDNHVLAYQPGSSSNLLAGSDGGIYVSNNAVNAPQGTLTGVNNPPTFKDVNLTMNTIESYGGDISSNFATSNNPFIVAGAQDNGSSYGQFGPGATCRPRAASGRSGSAATASSRASSPSRGSACSWRARTVRCSGRRPAPPARTSPRRARGAATRCRSSSRTRSTSSRARRRRAIT